jgi:pimeloyl-ACP methyl ester carboxylesterase
MKPIVTAAMMSALLAGHAAPAFAQLPPPAVAARPSACPAHEIAGAVRCATINVAENPARPDGRRIDLEVMILAARNPSPDQDPLFIIPGGPGQSATRTAGPRAYFAETFDAVRETRDIVLIAPRGTAGSGELRLDPPDALLFDALDTVIPPSWVRPARARLAAQADLTQYTTSRIADDLEVTRQALGYARINIYGTSYGTRVAQLYAARHPERVRAMILKAAVPPGVAVPLTYTPGAERALRLVFDRCAADRRCAAAYPDIARRFERLMARFARDPAWIPIPHPSTRAPVELVVTDTVFGYLLRNLLMSASGAGTALGAIDAADRGDFTTAASLISRLRGAYANELAGGMLLSVTAAEDLPRVDALALAADAEAGFLRGAVARGFVEAAGLWPRGAAPDDLYRPLRGAIPVLLVAGELDPATPPDFARRIAANLDNARVVVFTGGAHSGENFTGLDAMMAAFIAAPDPMALDISAARNNRPLPLIEAGTDR